MSKQYPAGIISKTAIVPTGPYEDSSASGIWTLDQQAYWNKQGLWPTAGSTQPDAYFNYVTMLLHGDGTNGAQNNTFLDSSTNNFTITRNGNTTQGTFTPYGSNWSNYFDGSGDYLTVPNSTAFDLSTSDFTIEGFFYPTVGSAFQSVFAYASNAGASISDYAFQLLLNSSNGINFRVVASGGSSFTTISTSNTFTLNYWNYVCVTRTGTSVSVYLNGTTTTGTIASTIRNNASSILTIGRDPDGSYSTTGYLSNLRILKGTAVTPSTPTTPLTAITNTSLLTCADNRFIDDSTNNFTITKNGDVSVQRFSPFSPTTAYSTSVIGGSGYFDGTGDYLNIANQTALHLGGGDFSIECWTYLTSTSGAQRPISQNNSNYEFAFFIANGGGITAYSFQSSGTQNFGISGGTLVTGQWYHLACTRTGSTVAFFVNGVRQGTATFSGTVDSQTGGWRIGANGSGTDLQKGYITDSRLVFGSNPYGVGTTLTLPTAPLTAVTNTQLLTNFTNAGILDNAMMNDLETVGNAQISTSVKKYGTGSISFDGTDDRLTSASSPNIAFGTGDFTVEAWIYPNVLTGERGFIQTSDTVGGLKTSFTTGVVINIDVSPYRLSCNIGGTNINSGSTYISATTWTHVAITRASGSVRMFINGILVGGPTTITADLTGQNICVGGYYNTSYLWNGYIDDLRITKGVARYTATFTPPTKAFIDF